MDVVISRMLTPLSIFEQINHRLLMTYFLPILYHKELSFRMMMYVSRAFSDIAGVAVKRIEDFFLFLSK